MDTELSKLHTLDILLAEELKRICEKHKIKYFMIAGTLLGAVRHRGFIPWDDDMDFGMRRVEFERFVEVCSYELNSEKFQLQTMYTEKEYPFNFVKITLKGTSIIEEFSKGKLKNNGIFIDIFPVDNVSDNNIKAFFQMRLFWLFRNLLLIKLGYGEKTKKFYTFGRI
ncbi:TPA: phosphorylcholine transferase LicD, partial [Streptococcus suis]